MELECLLSAHWFLVSHGRVRISRVQLIQGEDNGPIFAVADFDVCSLERCSG
jgi:hypothetical protein